MNDWHTGIFAQKRRDCNEKDLQGKPFEGLAGMDAPWFEAGGRYGVTQKTRTQNPRYHLQQWEAVFAAMAGKSVFELIFKKKRKDFSEKLVAVRAARCPNASNFNQRGAGFWLPLRQEPAESFFHDAPWGRLVTRRRAGS